MYAALSSKTSDKFHWSLLFLEKQIIDGNKSGLLSRRGLGLGCGVMSCRAS
jgi:hypothetical protein